MAEFPASSRLASADLVACVEETMQVATLRYFTREGAFAEALRTATGMPLPAALDQSDDAPAIAHKTKASIQRRVGRSVVLRGWLCIGADRQKLGHHWS